MSKLKKVFAIILSMAMILGMSLTTFAANLTGTIKVNNADGATVNYAKIVEEDRNSVYGWDFVESAKMLFVNAWLNRDPEIPVTDTDRDQVIAALIEMGKLENINGHATTGDVNDTENYGEKYASALQAVAKLATNSFDASEGIDVAKPENGIGLYLITASKPGYTYIPMAAYVGTNFSGVTVEAKGSKDQITKTTTDGQSAMTGDIINYEVTVEYPYYPADATSTKFVVSDTLQNATFVGSSLKIVDQNNVELVAGSDYTTNDYADETNMTITFDYNNDKAGDVLTITYQAKVGDLTGGAQVSNSAKSDTENGYTVAEVKSDSAEFKVIKTDDTTGTPKKLSGAVFTLYVADINGNVSLKVSDGSGGYTTVKANEVSKSAPTDNNGEAVFKGLDVDKTYYVKETTAPEGYSVNDEAYLLAGASKSESTDTTSGIDENKISFTKTTTTYTVTDYTSQTVKDSELSKLPSTGGIGTTIFTIGGCVIMIAAAGLYFASRRKQENK